VRILLTGATGWIGSHVARELVRRGHEVHAVVRPTSDRRRIGDLESKMTVWEGEIDRVPVGPEVTIHLAWFATPGKYLTAPENRDCLEASRRLLGQVSGRVLAAGTCFEYDTRLGKLREDSPTRPTTLYAECKDALRREVEARPNSAWLRFFYQYGPEEDERRLVPAVIRSLVAGEPARVSLGEQRRSFLHIEDVATAVVSVALSALTGVVNVGSADAPAQREMVETIARITGRPELVQWGAIPYYPGEPMLIQADNTKLRTTGWTPRYDLESGLRQTIDWWRRELR
jgi:nucleoside-diphosphate-sugar epimerase